MADAGAILARKHLANTPAIIVGVTGSNGAYALTDNPDRAGWTIQNLGTNTLFVELGSGASTAVFHYALKAGSVNDDGSGGSVSQNTGSIYTGPITVAGTAARYVVTEL